jgi:tetratricopeptide (TPR) repeat protein
VGPLCLSLGRRREALEHLKAAVRLGREIGYPRGEGYSLRGLGIALETTGDAEGAAEAYRRAAELLEAAYEESGMDEDLAAKAEALNLLATVLHRVPDRRGRRWSLTRGPPGYTGASGTTGAWARSRWDGVACSGG